jgi:hypothetical protein
LASAVDGCERRKVDRGLPLLALEKPDRAQRHFPVKLTTQQVKDSPDVDTDQPVSRQLEAHVYNFNGWDP